MAITIIGYRGTGKTTVGAELAQRLGWEYIDTDPQIEARAGKSIKNIFAEDGEPAFRDLERQEIARHLGRGDVVLSVGGGAILCEKNRRLMREAGKVIWLVAEVSTIAARLQGDPTTADRRPTLTGTDPYSEIVEVLNRRKPLYEAAASHVIDTEGRLPEAIVDEILRQIR
ncbi:shikimate kinase [Planctomicrobium sp. SH668]|uniref:shikimate kinase n=1 Tax=Planctomicrobium sp. SH668 TaxID=3448126 RepID=UPI003F5B3035